MSSTAPELPPALAGELRFCTRRAGRLGYYVGGPKDAPPMLLVHSVNAAASAYEVKPVFDAFSAERRIYVPDLPGFGFSDRSRRDYTIRLYCDALRDMLDVMADDGIDAPIDALAVSLGSEFLARVAAESPQRFRSLALVTPTGFSGMSPRYDGPAETSRRVPGMHALVSLPLWSRALFDLLTRPASIRYFLRRTYGSSAIDEGMAAYDHLTARQPGAQHAPLAFLSAHLFSRDIRNVYEMLSMPIWVPHATRGDFRNFSGAGWAQARSNWRFQPMPTGAMPHFERPGEFIADYRSFLAAAATAAAGMHPGAQA